MSMLITRILSPQLPQAGEWWQLYETAFPASERRSRVQHAAALQDAAFHCLHLADAEGFAGILSYWQWPGLCFVEHLAVQPADYTQMDLFADPEADRRREETEAELKREKRRQQAVLTIKKKFGKNAIVKGMNLEEGATAMDRNGQIGGHKA